MKIMSKKWDTEELELLKLFLEQNYTYKEMA